MNELNGELMEELAVPQNVIAVEVKNDEGVPVMVYVIYLN